MKRFSFLLMILAICASTFAFAAEEVVLRWTIKVHKSVQLVRYQLNAEDEDGWTTVEANDLGYIVISTPIAAGDDCVFYIQQTKDGEVWSDSTQKIVPANTIADLKAKKDQKAAVASMTPAAGVDTVSSPIASGPVSDTTASSGLSASSATPITAPSSSPDGEVYIEEDDTTSGADVVVPEAPTFTDAEFIASAEDVSGYKTAILIKPQVALDVDGVFKNGDKLTDLVLAPRLDLEFRFENIASKKKNPTAGFDISLNLGWETRPYGGWAGEFYEFKQGRFLDPAVWYNKVSIDLGFGAGFNAGPVRPYFAFGAGVMAYIYDLNSSSSFAPPKLFDIIEATADKPLGLYGSTYVLGRLGLRFHAGAFAIGLEATYKLFVVSTDVNDLVHSIDCGITIGASF